MSNSVLIVDDEQPVGYMLSKQLEKWGCQCATALSGQEALTLLERRQFDLMLLDVRMPGMSGLEVLEQSKRDYPSMPVVMLSAVINDLTIVADAIALGAEDYIKKPCPPDDLKRKILHVMVRGEHPSDPSTNSLRRYDMTQSALIVDDEQPVQYLLSKQLEKWGYECAVASNGQEALEELANKQFDLMLLDVRMPGMSGLEVLRRSRDDQPSLCVVMLSALIDVKYLGEAIALGADDYISKPCDPDDLDIRLRKAREHRGLVNQRNSLAMSRSVFR